MIFFSEPLVQFFLFFRILNKGIISRLDILFLPTLVRIMSVRMFLTFLFQILPLMYGSVCLLAKGNRIPPSLVPSRTLESPGVNLRSLYMQILPFPLLCYWIAGLRTVGVRIPQSLLDLARLDSVPRVMSEWAPISVSLIRSQGRLRSWRVFVRMV